MAKYKSFCRTVEVEIDLEEIVASFADDLRELLGSDGAVVTREDLSELRTLLLQKRPAAALAMIESLLFPKEPEEVSAAYWKNRLQA